MSSLDRPAELVVIADHLPGAHRTDSSEVRWWLPVIGPTSSCLAVILAHHARHHAEVRFDTSDLARRVGLGGNRSKLWASLERLALFRCATFVSTNVLTIRLELPALTEHQQHALPATMAERYTRAARQAVPS